MPDYALLLVQDEILLKSIDLLRLADFKRPQFLMITVEILHKVEFHNLQDELILEVHKDYSLTPNLDLVVARNLQIQILYKTATKIIFPIKAIDQEPPLSSRIIELTSSRYKNLSSIR